MGEGAILARVRDAVARRRGGRADAVDEAGPTEFGSCAVCGHVGSFDSVPEAAAGFRSRCRGCGASSRHRQQADVLVDLFSLDRAHSVADLVRSTALRHLDVYEIGIGGPFHRHLARLPGYVRSYFWADIPRGESREGVRSEDLEALTFADETFDLVISFDVFEHVRHPEQAFAQVRRVLKPGGHHVFTVPMTWPLAPRTRSRVDTSGPDDVFLLEARYHTSPRDPGGALVYTDFGLDLAENLRLLGYRTAVHFGVRNNVTFVSTRPRAGV